MNYKVKTETIVRTVVLAATTTNTILIAVGKSPIPVDEGNLYLFASLLAQGIASVWAWWKNNSFTMPAIKADKYLEELKN